MKWPDNDEPPACTRLHTWLNGQDASPASIEAISLGMIQSLVGAACNAMRLARKPLIWLESVDVQATRMAVQLAQATGATLHVAQSPGAELVASIQSSDGWLGTTLAEVGSTASLVIHLGQQHLRDAPMFELRFANPNAQHLFLDQCPDEWLKDTDNEQNSQQLQWTKAMWLDGLTRTLLIMRDESSALSRPADAVDVAAGMLAEMLLASHYSVIVWSEDELTDELDGLIVRRLLELARLVNRSARCSLLCMSQDPGRTTAKDAVLWLTNRTSPIRFVDGSWQKDSLHPRSLDQWQDAFDWILCVRNLPSDRPLPELKFDVVIDAHCNLKHGPTTDSPGVDSQAVRSMLPVSAVGLDAPGHLLRTDHGLAAMIHHVTSSASAYPHAAEILHRFTEQFRSAPQGLAMSEGR